MCPLSQSVGVQRIFKVCLQGETVRQLRKMFCRHYHYASIFLVRQRCVGVSKEFSHLSCTSAARQEQNKLAIPSRADTETKRGKKNAGLAEVQRGCCFIRITVAVSSALPGLARQNILGNYLFHEPWKQTCEGLGVVDTKAASSRQTQHSRLTLARSKVQSGASYRSQGFEDNVWEVPPAD